MTGRTALRLRAIPSVDRLAGAAMALLLAVVAVCVAAPWIAPADPTAVDYLQASLPPSLEHPFGTDAFGRDVLTRVLYGGRVSLATAAVAVTVIVTVGAAVGAVCGYVGGPLDLAVTRLLDVLLAFPRLVLAIALAALLGGGVAGVVLAVSLVSWPGYARLVRGYALQIRDEGYVQAARCAGTPWWRIVRTHVAGAITGPVLVLAVVDVGEVILAIAGLSFLGLGVRPPAPEWGAMLNEARPYIEDAPWMFLAPGLAIFLVVLAVNYLGDAVRDALEPRLPRLPQRPVWTPPWRRGERHAARRQRATAIKRHARAASTSVDTVELARLDGVHVSAGNTPILAGVTLRLSAGQTVGLVGQSGSGKSTLAATLLGLLRPPLRVDSGTVTVLGHDTAGWDGDDWRQVRGRHVGLVSQDPLNALNPVLTVGTQVAEAVRAHHRVSRAEARARARAALELVRLPPRCLDAYPHQLSGGMRQRVAIATAVVNRPSLLVCDEPTTALDVSTQARILDELARLREELGIGLLFISHDLRLVSQVAERVVVLHQGAVAEDADARTLFTAPTHPYTRRLLAALPTDDRQARATG
ncbi:ATP-binding cassette domain-containing protein [Phytohabitans kaempferiae]|uniref:ATP-binding cassette domain-containing protein n=1 Tax=Phytohabitans kaempferiae TaxID=1620943 RepID=A0ABV6MI04_9ACTN